MTVVSFASHRHFTADTPRPLIEDEIERLFAILDRRDGDPDVEPDLGWSITCAHGTTDDREGDDEREWDQAEQGIADMDGMLEQTGQAL